MADGEGLGEGEVLTLSVGDGLELGDELSVAAGLVDAVGVELGDAVGDGLDARVDALATVGANR